MLEKIITKLTPEEAKIVEGFMQAKSAPKGTVLIEQGDTSRDLYFLVSGHYEIFQKVEMSRSFYALKIASLTGPLVFGEANLLLAQERNATILISEEAKYLLLPYEKFLELQKNHPGICCKILAYAGKVVTDRFNNLQSNLHERMVASADNPQTALLRMNNYIGNVQLCGAEIARKLFNLQQNEDEFED